MKRFSKYSILLVALLLGACKKFSPELNVSPNNPSSAPYLLILTGAEVSGVGIYEGTLARTGGMFARCFTGADRQYVDLYNYNTTAEDYNDGWDNLYAAVIGQLQTVETGALAVNDKLTAGIVEIQLAEAFGFATDLWGDVPFSQVGDPVKYPTPAFDPQVQVYAGVQALLTKGLANIAAGVGAGPGGKDFLFSGDPTKWTQAGNTLRARFSLHTRDYAGAIAAAKLGINDASGSGDLKSPHGSSYLVDFNIYYSFLAYDRPGYMTADGAIAAAYLDATSALYKGNAKTNESARYSYLYTAGLITSGLDPNVSGPDYDGNPDGFFANDASFPRVTYAENNLILAEAYAKTNDNTDALSSLNIERTYMNGGGYITPAYLTNGNLFQAYTLTDFGSGGVANAANLSVSAALLTEILKERYVTFIGQVEEYNDVRRTGNYLKIPPTKGTTLPQRFFYAQDEINTNKNTPKQAPADLFKPTTVNSTPY